MRVRQLPLLLPLLFLAHAGQADDTPTSTPEPEELTQEIQKIKQANQVYEQIIRNLIQRIEHLETNIQGRAVPSPEEASPTENKLDPDVAARLKKESEENYQLIQTAFEQRLSREGGMLLPNGTLVYELGLSYTHASYDKIVVDGFTVYPVLVIGDIVAEKIRRNIFTNNHALRFGLDNDMQMDLLIPIGYENENAFRDDGTHDTKRTKGRGDIAFGFSRQLIKSHRTWPDTVLGLNWKTATGGDPYEDQLALGTGFRNFGLSLTSMSTSDPVVLFGGLSSTFTATRAKAIGDVKPGTSHGLNLGMALALNFDTSLSFNYQLQFTEKTRLNGKTISGSETTTSTFVVGFSRAKSDHYAIDIDLGIGLTQDSPDFQLSVSFPFSFSAPAGT